ncbi:MAG: hypothetical protein J5523_02455 [Muribaculaceae bacterium]|nr:hypothetical protein [Muribaculaceae bacterium]
MKKLFQFAIVAVVAAGLVACAKSENKAEGSASAETSVSAQDAAEAVAENDYYKIANIPAGWEKGNVDSEKTIVINLKPGTELGDFENVSFTLFEDFAEPQQYIDEILNNNASDCRQAEDLKIGEQTYKQLIWNDNADNGITFVTQSPKGVIDVTLSKKLDLDNPDVKAIIESFTIK